MRLSRSFNTKEKILLAVLALVLLALAYYYFVDQPLRSTLDTCNAEADALQTELDVYQQTIMHLREVQNSMDELRADDNMTWMSSYNNSKQELAFLNEILADTLQYSISFANVTRTGSLIRRSFTLQYRTRTYDEAQQIMKLLLTGKDRCLVSDVKCTVAASGEVTMSQSATFYETMVGGTPDAGLPVDSAAVNE